MKNSIKFLFLSLFMFSACGGAESLEELKKEKISKQGEIDAKKAELKEIEDKIAKLDTTSSNDKLEQVTILELNKGQFNQFIEAQGKTYSEDNVMVTTDMGGLVRNVLVEEGQYVNKGQTLFQLDNSIILNQITELETSIALSKDVFDKRERLWNQNIGSEIEYLQAKSQYESLLNKKATLNTQLSKANIKAPINGIVDVVNLSLGEMASPGMPACQVINNKEMEVKVDLPEAYLGKVKKGDKILVDIPTLEMQKTAVVKSVGQSVNNFNRGFQVIASIENSKGEIKTNMLAKVKFSEETVNNALVIPAALLQESAQGYFVYIAKIDSTNNKTIAVKQAIEIGESYEGNVVVKEGLTSGNLIINKGFRNVLDGQSIQIQK